MTQGASPAKPGEKWRHLVLVFYLLSIASCIDACGGFLPIGDDTGVATVTVTGSGQRHENTQRSNWNFLLGGALFFIFGALGSWAYKKWKAAGGEAPDLPAP